MKSLSVVVSSSVWRMDGDKRVDLIRNEVWDTTSLLDRVWGGRKGIKWALNKVKYVSPGIVTRMAAQQRVAIGCKGICYIISSTTYIKKKLIVTYEHTYICVYMYVHTYMCTHVCIQLNMCMYLRISGVTDNRLINIRHNSTQGIWITI